MYTLVLYTDAHRTYIAQHLSMLGGRTSRTVPLCWVDAHRMYLSAAGGRRRTSLSPSWVPALWLSQLATGFFSILTSICLSFYKYLFEF